MSAYFEGAVPPRTLSSNRSQLDDFIFQNSTNMIACITSGGTTVPLERNTVRFIDNFSTGNRGAALTEHFLGLGYAVIFIYRTDSTFPFVREFLPPVMSAENLLKKLCENPCEVASKQENSAKSYTRYRSKLLALPFTSVDEYLWLLREACFALSVANVNERAMVILAAAVSDFFIPTAELVGNASPD